MRKINDEGVIIVMMPREVDKTRDMLRLSISLMTDYIEKMQRLMQEEGVNRREAVRLTEEHRANAFSWLEELAK